MSSIPKGYRPQTSLVDMLTLPVTDFSAFRVVLFPKVSCNEFRKNFYRLLSYGKALSLNGKTPSLLASLFQCADALPLYESIGAMSSAEVDYVDSDVYASFVETSRNEKEIVIRHAADTSHNYEGRIDLDEKGLAIFVYTDMGNGLCRKYQLTWVPATANRPSSLVIYFEQSSLRNLVIAYPPNANADITQLINIASHYRDPEKDIDRELAKHTQAMAWAFFWDEYSKPAFTHTYFDGDNAVQHHLREVPPFSRFPVLNALGFGWDINKYVDERCASLLFEFTNKEGAELVGQFQSIVGLRKADGSIDFTFTGIEGEEVVNAIAAKVNHLFSMCYMTPEIKNVSLSYADNKFTLVVTPLGLGADNRPRTYYCEV